MRPTLQSSDYGRISVECLPVCCLVSDPDLLSIVAQHALLFCHSRGQELCVVQQSTLTKSDLGRGVGQTLLEWSSYRTHTALYVV